jgi:presenilin-like A22 family membrane protease
MLGLGDIVIPGIFVALLLRYDVASGRRTSYFASALGGYVVGLTTTIVVRCLDPLQPFGIFVFGVHGCRNVLNS